MNNAEELGKCWGRLEKRILKHRNKCPCWNSGKPCFDCHYNVLTPIKKLMDDICLLYPK